MTAAPPQVVTDLTALRGLVSQARQSGARIGLVPTMGALHPGHLSLVRRAREECESVVVTVFVNPTQFGPGEDFDRYPRDLAGDLRLLGDTASLVFSPPSEAVYPTGHATTVHVAGVTERWEGPLRPGHFDGVATIVLKLFQMVGADVAYFGQKDYQQSVVIRRMVADLNVPIELRVCPTIRESDGLAMSSRNAYLTPEQRRQATVLSRGLKRVWLAYAQGQREAAVLANLLADSLAEAPDLVTDYAALADAHTLEPVERVDGPAVALVAGRLGRTRLIDNCLLDESLDPAQLDRWMMT